MPQFCVAIYLPDTFDPGSEPAENVERIHALNREMIAAGVRKLATGLAGPAEARTIRTPDGNGVVTDGPYTETKEHVGGFWILETATKDEAVAWAQKAAVACNAPVEVREMFFAPAPELG